MGRHKDVSTALSRAPLGLAAPQVRVEVHLGCGLPTFVIVGLPEAVVRESKERVRAALVTSGFEFPTGRITVNLSPAELPKEAPPEEVRAPTLTVEPVTLILPPMPPTLLPPVRVLPAT